MQPSHRAEPRGEVVERVGGDHAIGERPGSGELDLDESSGGQLLQDMGRELADRHAGRHGMGFLLLGGALDLIQEEVPGLDR